MSLKRNFPLKNNQSTHIDHCLTGNCNAILGVIVLLTILNNKTSDMTPKDLLPSVNKMSIHILNIISMSIHVLSRHTVLLATHRKRYTRN